MSEGTAPLKPSIAKTSLDTAPFDSNRSIGVVSDGELATAVAKAGHADAHHNGRQRNAELWSAHVAQVRKQAGDTAMAAMFGAGS